MPMPSARIFLLVLLLTIWSKRRRWFLGGVAALLLAGLWVER